MKLFSRLKYEDDTNAFNDLYLRHRETLLLVAHKHLQCRQMAEDVIQDIFTSFYQRRQLIDVKVSVKAYLLQSLKYKLINEIRSRKVRNRHRQHVFFVDGCKIGFSIVFEQKEVFKAVQHALDHLPDKCREVFILSRYMNCSNKDISQKMNISVSTVEKHMCKALKTMRMQLEGYQQGIS